MIIFLFLISFLFKKVKKFVTEKSVTCSAPKSSIISRSQFISESSKALSLSNVIVFKSLASSSEVL